MLEADVGPDHSGLPSAGAAVRVNIGDSGARRAPRRGKGDDEIRQARDLCRTYDFIDIRVISVMKCRG